MRLRGLAVTALGLYLGGCVGDLELPNAPDVAHLAERYDSPSLELTADTAEGVIEQFIRDRDRLAQVDDFGVAVDAIIDFDAEVEVSEEDDDPTVSIAGAPIHTDAVVEVRADCPGFADGAPIDSALELTVVIRRSELVPVLWGQLSNCRIEPELVGVKVPVEYSADLTAYLPNVLGDGDEPFVVYILYEVTELNVAGEAVPGWAGDFRIVGERLEILVSVLDLGHLVVFGNADRSELGVRAANGDWSCFPQERRCESLQLPAFSY